LSKNSIIIEIPSTSPILPTSNVPYSELPNLINCETVALTSNSEVSNLFESEPSTSHSSDNSLQYCEEATTSAVAENVIVI